MKNKNTIKSMQTKDLIFCLLMLAYPTIQFILFYIGVNFNSVLLAFKGYDPQEGFLFVGLENFNEVFYGFTHTLEIRSAIVNSLKVYAITILICLPLALLFSFYIYKKAFANGLFRVVLFLPSVVSTLVMCLMFRYFTDMAYPEIIEKIFGVEVQGLFSNAKTKFFILAFFYVWSGFGANVLMYTGAMSGIDESIIESAQLDGINIFKEFIYFSIPLIWPTITTFLVSGLAGLFSNQFNLFSFFGSGAEIYHETLGYYMYKQTLNSISQYPLVSTMGIILSIVMVPLVLLVKRGLVKIGPKTE